MDNEREPTTVRRIPADNVLFKILVPSIAAGAIIGKGGEAIAQLQKEKGAKVKMSKSNDFYPGTTERVCLIQGTVDSIIAVCTCIMEQILEKPDPNPKLTGDGKLNLKILVPNSTAGMIIGKKGAFIKEIMDASGAFVQVSQKPKDQALSERCVTVAGDSEANRAAAAMIVAKIAEDPQSASCPNISYSDISGPPLRAVWRPGSPQQTAAPTGGRGLAQQLSLSSSQNSASSAQQFAQISADALRASLRQSGYSEAASDEIVGAMATLANYGFFNMQSLVPAQMPLISTPSTPMPPLVASPMNSYSLPHGSLSALQAPPPPPPINDGAAGAVAASNDFSSQLVTPGGGGGDPGAAAFIFPSGPAYENYGAAVAAAAAAAAATGGVYKRDVEVPESLIGVVLGPGGRDIAELQTATHTCIQVSKRGDSQTQSRNRVVSITGMQANVLKAERVIQQRVTQEDQRRKHPSGASRHS
uniref:RNA-binding protein Nova-1 n=1 Tax=Macrostomum lignano TaxID=282301 RepID=A0A1I8J1L1_9PLAT